MAGSPIHSYVLAGSHSVAIDMAVACMSAFNCSAVTLHIRDEADETGSRHAQQVKNLDRRQWQQFLNSNPTSLPAKTTHDRKGQGLENVSQKSKLRNQIIDALEADELGWHASVTEVTGKEFVDKLNGVLWAISSWHGVFRERGTTPFLKILSDWGLVEKSWMADNRCLKQQAKKAVTQDELKEHEATLYSLSEKVYIKRQRWQTWHDRLVALARCLEQQRQWLHKRNEAMSKVHHSEHRLHVPDLDDYLIFREAAQGQVLEQYRELDIALRRAPLWEPVPLNDDFLPVSRQERHAWLHHIATSLPMYCFCYHQGGTKPSLWWSFKVTISGDEECIQTALEMSPDEQRAKLLTLCEVLRSTVVSISTRAERQAYHDRFSKFTELNKNLRNSLFEHPTSSRATKQHQGRAEYDSRMTAILLLDDWEMVEELKAEMKGDPKGSLYDVFWEELDKLLHEQAILTAEQNRQDDLSRVAIDITYAALRREVEKRVPAGTNIPSEKWFDLQFFPANIESRQALNHTGRYAVKKKVQTRTMRKQSPDAPYGLESWRQMKAMAVMWGENAVMCCQDDKTKVPVGEPNNPVAATSVPGKAPQRLEKQHGALDHDVSKFSIVPSANFFIDIPDSVQGSFYMGQPWITLKDATFQMSHPLRHTVEFLHLLYTEYDPPNQASLALVLKYHDGGADHNVTHAWVQLCCIIEWLHSEVDLLLSERCVPGQSYIDPAERTFSKLNLALQCTSLERDRAPKEVEQLIPHANSMAAIRKVAEENPSVPVKEELLKCMEKPMQELTHLFGKVRYGGNQFKIGKMASDVSMQTVFDTIHKIDSGITMDDVKAMHQMHKKFPKLKEFCDTHCSFSTYMCQVNCNAATHRMTLAPLS
jgi:hypothetical protein